MKDELLLLIKKHTDTLTEQTKTRPQETLEFKMNKQMQYFSFSPPINSVKEDKWFSGVSSFECKISVFNITNKNNSFSITVPGCWRIANYLEDGIIDKLKNLLNLRSQNDIKLHVEEVIKRGSKIKINDKNYKLLDFDTSIDEILEELKKNNYHDLEDMVNRMQLAYNEIMDVLDIKYFPSERTGYTLPPGIYEVSDTNTMLKYLLPDIVKISYTIDDIRLKSKLNINQTLIFTKRYFFYTILGFTQSHQGALNNIEGFYQVLPGKYKSGKSIDITGNDKVHKDCDCINGLIVNGIREPILYSLTLDKPPGRKILKEPRINFSKKINISVLFHITF